MQRRIGWLVLFFSIMIMESGAQIIGGRIPDIREVFKGRSSDDWAAEQAAQGFHVPAGQKSLQAQLDDWTSVVKKNQVHVFYGVSVMRKQDEAVLVAESDAWRQAVSILPKPQKTQPGFLITQLDTTICADGSGRIVLLRKFGKKTQCVFYLILAEGGGDSDACGSPVHLATNSTTFAGGESLFDTMTQTIIHFSGTTRTLLEQSYFHYLPSNDEAVQMHGKLWEMRDAWSKPRTIVLE